jgi:hypothetical protein
MSATTSSVLTTHNAMNSLSGSATRKKALDLALVECYRHVLGFVRALLEALPHLGDLATLCLQCALGWAGVAGLEGLHTTGLLPVLCALALASPALLSQACDVLSEALAAEQGLVAADACLGGCAAPDGQRAAAGLVLRLLAEATPRWCEVRGDPLGEATCVAMSALAVRMCEREAEMLAVGSDDALRVTELCLLMLGHPLPAVFENALEALLALNRVPLNARHPVLRQPLYCRLSLLLAQRCLIPEGMFDPDAFARSRESLGDALLECYHVTGPALLGLLQVCDISISMCSPSPLTLCGLRGAVLLWFCAARAGRGRGRAMAPGRGAAFRGQECV